MKKEVLQLHLTYAGPDVDDGSMSVEDIVPALQGFSSAYGKIVAWKGIETKHNIRITGIRKGSFESVIEVWEWVGNNANQLQAIGAGIGGAAGIVALILQVIQLKKHTGNRSYTEKIAHAGENKSSIAVTNSENVTIQFSVDTFSLFKEKLLDQELSKIARPIEEGKIDSAVIRTEFDQKTLEETISLAEKPFFELETVAITSTQEVWLTGSLNSLTKTTNKGSFILSDGTRISYKLVNDKPEDLYHLFIHKGLVKVRCIANMDENLKPSSIDIFEIQKTQLDIFDTKKDG